MKWPEYKEEDRERVRAAMSSGEEWANDRPKSEAEREIEEATKRLKIEVVSAAGDVLKALKPVFREASKIISALVKLAKENAAEAKEQK